ncbi:MAG: hypothetical protein CMH66_11515 [Nioella sp.]|nr:hypothetical protein [Nioella sp.]
MRKDLVHHRVFFARETTPATIGLVGQRKVRRTRHEDEIVNKLGQNLLCEELQRDERRAQRQKNMAVLLTSRTAMDMGLRVAGVAEHNHVAACSQPGYLVGRCTIPFRKQPSFLRRAAIPGRCNHRL